MFSPYIIVSTVYIRFGPNADAWQWLGQPSPTSVVTVGLYPRQPDDVFSFLRDSFPSLSRSGIDLKEHVRRYQNFLYRIILNCSCICTEQIRYKHISCYTVL